MKQHRSAWLATVLALSLMAAVALLMSLPPGAECRPEVPLIANKHWFRATKVVVEPWKGPHHVYGIFEIPEQYKFDHLYTAKLTIHGVIADFQAGSPEDHDVYSGTPQPGHYIKRVYLSTRAAFWFFITGRFGDLRTTCHWWLIINDREKRWS